MNAPTQLLNTFYPLVWLKNILKRYFGEYNNTSYSRNLSLYKIILGNLPNANKQDKHQIKLCNFIVQGNERKCFVVIFKVNVAQKVNV